MWILEKDENNRYKFSAKGDMPRSTRDVTLHFKDGTTERVCVTDYLSIPPPRTSHADVIVSRLGIKKEVDYIDFWNGKFQSTFAYDDEHTGRRHTLSQD
jgi:hypothetical protein